MEGGVTSSRPYSIVGYDMVRFTARERSDRDRQEMFARLREIVEETLLAIAPDVEVISYDRGDGHLLALPQEFDKAQIITRLIPEIADRIREYNHDVADRRRLKIRCVAHIGELLTSSPTPLNRMLSPTLVSGTPLNDAARLLDSDALHDFVRRSNAPVSLFVSEEFFETIILQQLDVLAAEYIKVDVEAGGRQYSAFHRKEEVGSAAREVNAQSVPDARRGRGMREREAVLLTQLVGRAAYISTADVLNMALYEEETGSNPFRQHLETTLLLSDIAVIHCLDPLRSRVVLDVCLDYQTFIRDGCVLLVMGNGIGQNIRRDFRPYLARRAEQYLLSGHGAGDVAGLSGHGDTAEAVIDLTELSPYLAKRGFDGSASFLRLIREDLRARDIISVREADTWTLAERDLTLWQLIRLERVNAQGQAAPVIANEAQFAELANVIDKNLERESFSRRILLSIIRSYLDSDNTALDSYYQLMRNRVHVMHLRAAAGPVPFVEFRPSRDRRSAWYPQRLRSAIARMADVAPRDTFGPVLTEELRATESWNDFKDAYLASFAYSHLNGVSGLPPASEFEPALYLGDRKFDRVVAIVREHWA